MSVGNAEASSFSFPGLPGVFDVNAPKLSAGWLGGALPYSGVMSQAVQTIAITSRNAAENLLAVGYRGHAGYSKRFGGVDVNIDAVFTDNAAVSGAYGYQLSDFDNRLSGLLSVITTNSSVGKKVIVSGLYVTSITHSFTQNANCTTAWTFVGDGIAYENYLVSTSGAAGNKDYHCVNPLTWDEVHIYDNNNAVVLTGVQTATFTANINRSEVFQIGQFEPFDRTVQYPYNVTVAINTLSDEVNLTNWWAKFIPTYDPMSDCAGGLVIKVRTNSIANAGTARDFIIASGLRPTTSTLNNAVGSNATVALNFEGTSLFF